MSREENRIWGLSIGESCAIFHRMSLGEKLRFRRREPQPPIKPRIPEHGDRWSGLVDFLGKTPPAGVNGDFGTVTWTLAGQDPTGVRLTTSIVATVKDAYLLPGSLGISMGGLQIGQAGYDPRNTPFRNALARELGVPRKKRDDHETMRQALAMAVAKEFLGHATELTVTVMSELEGKPTEMQSHTFAREHAGQVRTEEERKIIKIINASEPDQDAITAFNRTTPPLYGERVSWFFS